MKTENLLVLGLVGYFILNKAYQLGTTTANAPFQAASNVVDTVSEAVSGAEDYLEGYLNPPTTVSQSGTKLRNIPGTNEYYYFNPPSWDARSFPTGSYVSKPTTTRRIVDNLTNGNYSEVWKTEGNTQYGYLVL